MILYYITIWARPRKPLFRIRVQKHSGRTHRFHALPLDVPAPFGFGRSEAKKAEGEICRQMIRANTEAWPPSSDFWAPARSYTSRRPEVNNSISLFFSDLIR